MAQTKAIVDKLLTDVSRMYIPEGYVSESILPVAQSKQKSGLIGKYGKSHLRIEHSLSGGRAAYRRVEPIVRSSDAYLIESHGLEGVVTEDDYSNVEQPFDAEKDEVLGLQTLIWLTKESALASALTSTAVLTQNTTLAGTDQFNDYANSDPLDVFKTARLAVYNGCGLPPNMAIMPWDVMNTLAYHPAILDALGFTQNRAGQLSEVELAKALGVEKLLVAKAKYNSAAEGQTDVLANVWGKDIVMCHVPASSGKYQTSLGYHVQLSGRSSRRVFKYDIKNPPNSTGITCDDSYDFVITDVGAGYLIKAAIA